MPIITLTTDFGEGSYVGQMKGVILSIAPGVTIVDITHAIEPQNIAEASHILREAAPWFPPDTIHVAVVDPGVGTRRAIVYARIGNQQFLAPDNGLLSGLAAREAPSTIITLARPEFWRSEVSHTFHGRDIFAPVAARLSQGLLPTELGPFRESLVQLDCPEAQLVANKITGQIASIDSFGNLVTNISKAQLEGAPRDEQLRVSCDDHETFGLFDTYAEQPPMTLIALVGSSGNLELAIVGDSAKIMLGVGVGAPVSVTW